MAKPIGTRPIPWLSDRDKLKQQFFEEVKFRLDQQGTNAQSGALIGNGVASATVPAYRAVTSDNLGQIILADSSTLSHADRILGISLTSSLAGEPVTYLIAGDVTNTEWAFQSEAPIFLGLAGALTEDPNQGVFQTRLGHMKTNTTLAVRIGLSIAF